MRGAALHHHSHAVGMIRLLASVAPRRRRSKRLPRQLHPVAIEAAYYRHCAEVAHAAARELAGILPELQRLLEQRRAAMGKEDAAEEQGPADRLLAGAARRWAAKFKPHHFERQAHSTAQQVSRHQQAQLDRQVVAATGVPLRGHGMPEPGLVNAWAERNVALIKTVPERLFDRIRVDVHEALELGRYPEDLASDFVERYGMAENDARRIARDQVGKLMADLNEDRQAELGVTAYIWRTMGDNRVREEHAALEGQQFDWDDEPPDGKPGDAVLCRCYAEPVLDHLASAADE